MTAHVRAFPGYRLAMASALTSADTSARNTSSAPDVVVPRPNPHVRLDDGRLEISLPPVSWNVVRLEPDSAAAPPT